MVLWHPLNENIILLKIIYFYFFDSNINLISLYLSKIDYYFLLFIMDNILQILFLLSDSVGYKNK